MQREGNRILCVDDDLDFCEMLAVYLEMEGYQVSFAHSVADGLEKARLGGMDLITLDGKYPDGTGLELCEMIRQFNTTTPIVFYSGRSDEGIEGRAFRAGAQAYLVKPADFEKFRRTISGLIRAGGDAA